MAHIERQILSLGNTDMTRVWKLVLTTNIYK